MGKPNQVFLFMCHYISKGITKEYEKLLRATKGIGEAYYLYHSSSEEIPAAVKEHNYYLYTYKSLASLNYPMLGPSLIPGHCHFPVLKFFQDNPRFDHYWLIEYDVRFSGNWHVFFDYFNTVKEGFLTSHIRSHADEPKWTWWSLRHPQKSIPISERLRSFNPIYRISNPALVSLHQSLQDGWCGHQEVVMPTLLSYNGFHLRDFGGRGRFTSPDTVNKFYFSANDQFGNLDRGTMRYRPLFLRVGWRKNKLYHPVKHLSWKQRIPIYFRRCWRFPLIFKSFVQKTRHHTSKI